MRCTPTEAREANFLMNLIKREKKKVEKCVNWVPNGERDGVAVRDQNYINIETNFLNVLTRSQSARHMS